ncbi:SH3 domain-containing protein [Bdellovibrio svalbardensis]|uniref:SH3 domain-containing protein n=1 Tax=Bdellovibrio svalbardensis TaxID=2972972 RepID=A0ABT6DG46_9BACT|nr:SH3 domain-containing protein [Bdellovibrio svalbardensis]MDG0815820.1 SH3 domain-containing protein [Bdellovibrio svalbardensis]
MIYEVVETYEVVYTSPIRLKVGEDVTITERETNPEWLGWVFCLDANGTSGWVSEKYLQINGNFGQVIKNYDATELGVEKGESVSLINEEFGWAWVKNSAGNEGWVPLKNLRAVSEQTKTSKRSRFSDKSLDVLVTMIFQGIKDVSTHIKMDEVGYIRIAATAHSSVKDFFLYGCTDEVMKVATAALRWSELLSESKEDLIQQDVTERVSRVVLEAIHDEMQMWNRKLTEILVDQILFKTTNDQEYYKLYFYCSSLETLRRVQKDFKEFYGFESGNVQHQIDYDISAIKSILSNIDIKRAWFLDKGFDPKKFDTNSKRILKSANARIKEAFALATPQQKLALGISYERGYSAPSRAIHASIGQFFGEVSSEKAKALFGKNIVTARHVILGCHNLLETQPKGLMGMMEKSEERDEAGDKVVKALSADYQLGDIVSAYGEICLVTDKRVSAFGYTSYEVEFLFKPMLPNLLKDYFPAQYIQMIAPRAKLIPTIQKIFSDMGLDPGKVTDDLVSQAIKQMCKDLGEELFLKSFRLKRVIRK